MIKAYCLKTKEKDVPMHEAVIEKTSRGGYKMSAILGETKALQAIKDGVAKQNF